MIQVNTQNLLISLFQSNRNTRKQVLWMVQQMFFQKKSFCSQHSDLKRQINPGLGNSRRHLNILWTAAIMYSRRISLFSVAVVSTRSYECCSSSILVSLPCFLLVFFRLICSGWCKNDSMGYQKGRKMCRAECVDGHGSVNRHSCQCHSCQLFTIVPWCDAFGCWML